MPPETPPARSVDDLRQLRAAHLRSKQGRTRWAARVIVDGPAVIVPARQAALLALALGRLGKLHGALPASAHELLAELTAVATASGVGSAEVPQGLPRRNLNDVTYLATGTAASRAGITERGIRDLCGRGTLEAEKVGGRWLIHPDSLAAYLDRKDTL